MSRSAKQAMILVAVAALAVMIFATGANAAGSCGISLNGLQGCLPSVPKPKVKEPCCKIMKGVDWSCFCFFELPGFSKVGFDPFFAINVAYGCNFVTPGVCL